MSVKYPGDVSLTQIFELIKGKLSGKVDTVDGKGLSTNDYTTTEKNKLAGISAGANKYTHPSHTAKSSGLYKVTVDDQGHVSATTAVTKKDITDLGIPGSNTDTTYSLATQETDGLLCCEDKAKLDSIEENANAYTHPSYTAKSSGLYKVTVDATGHVSSTSAVTKSDITGLGIPAQDTTYSAATQSANGLMSSSDKKKLDGITSGAEVNQNAFSNVVVGSTTIAADSKTDSLNLVAGDNVTITPDATNDKITIEAKDTVYEHPTHTAKSSGLYKITVDSEGHVSGTSSVSKSDITALGIPAQDTVYTHPSHTAKSSGLYKITVDDKGHVSAATAVAKSDITGLGIPAQDTTYNDATQSTHGLMSTADKTKLDGIATGANKTVVDSSLSSSSTNPVQNKAVNSALSSKLNTSLKGAANGLAELDSNGKVPTSQLPSYVDDVIEGTYASSTSFKDASGNAITGETGKIYVDTTSNKTYRWSGSAFVVISETIALGETSSTAYRGDRGKTAYDHSQITSGNPHGTTKSDLGLGNVENKSSATIRSELTKANVTTALGYTPPTTDTTYSAATQSAQGLMSAADKKKLDGIDSGANAYTHPTHTAKSSGLYKVTVDSQGHVSATASVAKSDITALGIPAQDTTYSDMTGATSSAAGTHGLVPAPASGKQSSFLRGDGTWATPTNTTYNDATQSTHGLMSTADKTKLDGIATGANKYTHPSYTAKSSGFYKVTVDSSGHVSAATAVAKSDITGLGIPAQDTTYSAATTSAAGLMSASDKSKLDGITSSADSVSFSQSLTSGTQVGTITINGTETKLYAPTDTNTTYSAGTGISLSGTTFSNSGVRSIATGSSNGTISVNTNGTTADVAVKGLGSAAYTASTAYAAASHGNHVPATETANNAKFLRNDNTWQTVTPANIGASAIGHTHTKSEITDFPTTMTPSAHNQAASTITAGTLAGRVQANATAAATLSNAQVRDIKASTTDLTAGSSSLTTGSLYFVYE